MVDQVEDHRGGHGAIESDRIPMPFVHVVAGLNGSILVAEGESTLRVAFEIHGRRHVGRIGEGEQFAAHLEHQDFGAERGVLHYVGQAQAMGDGFV